MRSLIEDVRTMKGENKIIFYINLAVLAGWMALISFQLYNLHQINKLVHSLGGN